MILWYFIIKPRVTVSVPHNKLRSFSKVISCLKFPSAASLFFFILVLNQLFRGVIFPSLIHLHTTSLPSLLFSFSTSLPLPLSFPLLFYQHSPSLPIFYMSLLYVNFPSSSLFSPGLHFPPSLLLMSHQSSPQRSRTDQLTAVSASVLT